MTRVADLGRPSVRRDLTPLSHCPVSPRSQFMLRRTLPSDPEAAQAILLEYTTERAVTKDVGPGHTHS